jgi:MFS transporter, ACDE family, multidrug resistance protein
MVYAAAPWAIGPMTGVWLHDQWAPAPFLLAGAFAVMLLGAFWVLRLGNGKQIQRAKRPAVNPLGYLGRFFRQPRLIAGWMFAVMRSCGWWVYVVYLPIFCIEAGLG